MIKIIKTILNVSLLLLITYLLCMLVVWSFCEGFGYEYSTEKTLFLLLSIVLYYWVKPEKDRKNG